MSSKSLFLASIVFAGFVLTAAVANADEKPKTVTYSIGIKGLTCETCSASVEREIAALSGVVESSVDWKSGHAWITLETPEQASIKGRKPRRISDELTAAISRAGASHGVTVHGPGRSEGGVWWLK